ncbi:MAG: hypothetical protein OXH52_17090 [Gammaproteobacteria bacterium]|nr:hypothetical protein [Gammaproteobacteria bacterium]
MRIAILGWGSLLWETDTDRGRAFNEHRKKWCDDGPHLNLEFSRISKSRRNALTLVLDYKNGVSCRVAYALSSRRYWEDAVCDLRCREGTTLRNIAYHLPQTGKEEWVNAHPDARNSVREWARSKSIDAVVWTALGSNFEKLKKEAFSVDAAKRHVQSLDAEGKARAAEYIWRAPTSVNTPVRTALQLEPWFPKPLSND